VVAGARLEAACEILGLTARTLERWAEQDDDGRHGPNTVPANKLTEAERRQIIAVTTSPEFRDQSPKQIVPRLADQGRYLASEATFYRVLAATTIKELNDADLWTTHSVLVFARAMRGSCVPLIDGVWKRQVLAVHEELAGPRTLNEKYWRLQELSQFASMVIYSGWAAITNRSLLWYDICRTLEQVHTYEDWSNDLDDWGIEDIDELDNAELDFETLEEIIGDLRDCLPTSEVSDPELAAQIRRAVDHAREMETCCQQLRDEAESRREDIVEPQAPAEESDQTERAVDIQSVLEDL
jgi:hypothetical protein